MTGTTGARDPSLVARALIVMVLIYRYSLSYFLGRQCRFAPTCSEYAVDAIGKHGAWHGTGLALRRIARCHPWGGEGYDPVPD